MAVGVKSPQPRPKPLPSVPRSSIALPSKKSYFPSSSSSSSPSLVWASNGTHANACSRQPSTCHDSNLATGIYAKLSGFTAVTASKQKKGAGLSTRSLYVFFIALALLTDLMPADALAPQEAAGRAPLVRQESSAPSTTPTNDQSKPLSSVRRASLTTQAAAAAASIPVPVVDRGSIKSSGRTSGGSSSNGSMSEVADASDKEDKPDNEADDDGDRLTSVKDHWDSLVGSGASESGRSLLNARSKTHHNHGWFNDEKRRENNIFTGLTGPPGPEGEMGAKGRRGKRGEKGSRGSSGGEGDKGPPGDTGPPGSSGSVGDSGDGGRGGSGQPTDAVELKVFLGACGGSLFITMMIWILVKGKVAEVQAAAAKAASQWQEGYEYGYGASIPPGGAYAYGSIPPGVAAGYASIPPGGAGYAYGSMPPGGGAFASRPPGPGPSGPGGR